MIGAIIGDIIGSRFEFGPVPEKDFKLFTPDCNYTDETICTIAIADALLNGKPYKETLFEWCSQYLDPKGGYEPRFLKWIESDSQQPGSSCGNDVAARVSPIGWLISEWEDVIEEAKKSAIVSHNHPESIKGAQCVAELICWLKHMRFSKHEAVRKVEKYYGYEIPPMHDILKIGSEGHFDGTCQETVPMAIRCFIDSNNFEDAIRLAVMADGDTDTKAAITGAIAEAYYDIPEWMVEKAISYLPDTMKEILYQFYNKMENDM